MFCLDTNVVIFAINQRRPEIAERLDREIASGTPIFVPAVVMFELEYGCAKSRRPEQSRRALEIFLSAGFDQPAFGIEDARAAGEIRALLELRGNPIGPYDMSEIFESTRIKSSAPDGEGEGLSLAIWGGWRAFGEGTHD